MAICLVRFFAKIRTVKRVRPAGHFPGDKRYGEKYRKAMSARQASAVTVERNLQAKAAERRHLRAGISKCHGVKRGCVANLCFCPVRKHRCGRLLPGKPCRPGGGRLAKQRRNAYALARFLLHGTVAHQVRRMRFCSRPKPGGVVYF